MQQLLSYSEQKNSGLGCLWFVIAVGFSMELYIQLPQ